MLDKKALLGAGIVSVIAIVGYVVWHKKKKSNKVKKPKETQPETKQQPKPKPISKSENTYSNKWFNENDVGKPKYGVPINIIKE
jgi:hypothetical protein